MSRHVITGGLGFLGSHLALRLARQGHDVVVLDRPSATASQWLLWPLGAQGFDRFSGLPGSIEFVEGDASSDFAVGACFGGRKPLDPEDTLWAWACDASPPRYKADPLGTLRTMADGIAAAVDVAQARSCRVVLASTSEVYGDPDVHPQPESYPGRVDPTGPRSMYDEGKRYAEAYLTHGLPASQRAIVRIFNTVGPCRLDDGRMVPAFVSQALSTGRIVVHGDGRQTRSIIGVDDLLDGIQVVVDRGDGTPYNVGNDEEVTVGQVAVLVADTVRRLTGRTVDLVSDPSARCPQDPNRRRPDLSKIRALGWKGPRRLWDTVVVETVEWMVAHSGPLFQ